MIEDDVSKKYRIIDRRPAFRQILRKYVSEFPSMEEAFNWHSDHWNAYYVLSENVTSTMYMMMGQPKRWYRVSLIHS